MSISLDTRALALLIIALDEQGYISNEGLGGITRLQKYLFLLNKEKNILSAKLREDFDFVPYKAGPYSSKLYDDLEFLENLGYIQSEVTAEATEAEATEVDLLSFDNLMNNESTLTADAYEEKKYYLTSHGKKFVEKMLNDKENEATINDIKKMKKKFKNYSLTDLLRYVYTKYPEMTTESEIKDRILGK